MAEREAIKMAGMSREGVEGRDGSGFGHNNVVLEE